MKWGKRKRSLKYPLLPSIYKQLPVYVAQDVLGIIPKNWLQCCTSHTCTVVRVIAAMLDLAAGVIQP